MSTGRVGSGQTVCKLRRVGLKILKIVLSAGKFNFSVYSDLNLSMLSHPCNV